MPNGKVNPLNASEPLDAGKLLVRLTKREAAELERAAGLEPFSRAPFRGSKAALLRVAWRLMARDLARDPESAAKRARGLSGGT